MNDTLSAIGSLLAAIVSLVALVVSLRRASQEKTDADIHAIVTQMRALELEVAKNYVTRGEVEAEIGNLAKRLEGGMKELGTKIEDLNRFIREHGVR